MKSSSIILALLSLTLIYGCEKENNIFDNIVYLKDAKLKRVWLYSSLDSKEPISIESEYEYDDEGRVNKVSSPMYQDGKIAGIIKYDLYKYNSQGQLLKIECFNANSNSPTGFINLKNYFYTYSDNGIKEKEAIEYPQIGLSEYSIYKYELDKLTKIEKYDNSDNLQGYIINEYNDSGYLMKETHFAEDNQPISYTRHIYKNRLNVQSDVFGGENMDEHIRKIFKTYDKNDNLIILESNELSLYSSMMSHVLKFEYYE
jgi:hypothetical protein